MISFRLFGTNIIIKPVVLVNIILLWGAITWFGMSRNPGRGFWQGLLLSLLLMILLLVADIGHAIAHIFSARFANTPMDEILISAGMPRTRYFNNEVSPAAHRMRAMGGPIFSGLGLLVSFILYRFLSNGSVGRELAVWSMVGHGFILVGSLLPLPIVDGGAILKWTIIEKGKTEKEADNILRRINWTIGIVGLAIGMSLMAVKIWIVGLVFVGVGCISIGVAVGKIR